ncbi:MAG: hypothetical protein EHM14_12225 [Methanothrix sp.]|nr:MAG: hypothetical protein EHM14_12225 [Methanothrix sp.]
MERSDIIRALESLDKKAEKASQDYETAAERGYSGVCIDCPFIPLFRALARLDASVAGDAGCAIRTTREPYESVDVVYGLGSSIGVASGFIEKGVAVVGDYALAHSGLQGLINAIWQKREVVVVVLKNNMAAMTGGQAVPDLTKLLETLVRTRFIEVPGSVEEIESALNEELAKPGSSAIVVSGRCAKIDKRIG